MEELPDEVLQQIFFTLTARDLLHATCTFITQDSRAYTPLKL